MAGENKVLEIHAALKGKTKERFLEIKRYKGLSEDKILELMINEYFEKKLAADKAHGKPERR